MHIISTGSFVFIAGIIYKVKHNHLGPGVAVICGVIISAAVMIPANLLVTPLFMSVPMDVIKEMLLPIIIPFNLIKAGINGVVTFLLYKSISKLIGSHN